MVDLRLRTFDCGLSIADCGLRIADCEQRFTVHVPGLYRRTEGKGHWSQTCLARPRSAGVPGYGDPQSHKDWTLAFLATKKHVLCHVIANGVKQSPGHSDTEIASSSLLAMTGSLFLPPDCFVVPPTKKQSTTMSLRGVFCRSNPLNTSEEIASSQNPLLAMTESLFLAQ